ncbi:PSD1 and planctomycete cytochrome C domain-containing protein [Aeoliella sp. SH292]|uniref:PSD1 and planctomycete cytochrome C domain-containing protein n=1 Tax=Aeoliella sp. SH292 TaxID=3454464 RepID=UPI003F9B5262
MFMDTIPPRQLPRLATLLFAAVLSCVATANADEIRFGRDVLPILSDRCFHCHGPDESHREADLRLDIEDEAKADRGGYSAVVPGDAKASAILERITTDDPDLLMPPADSHRKPLTAREVAILKEWIASGAPWGKHWAFEKPERPAIDDTDGHPIDILVRRRLAAEGLKPSPTAPPHTLARRVALDLTGLPPSPLHVAALQADASPEMYGKIVDDLLASPHYGERMAMWWLDAARYSDTDGFQQDANRNNWPWRDWVVREFNANTPFDQFTIEQLAGDLLPDATRDQHLATCFHRNHQTNGEGGRDPEESRVDYVIDRVNTTGTVWLGLTLGCCQCHSHKFDPISQKEYYQVSAFFNSIDESGEAGNNAGPYLKYQSPLADAVVDKSLRLVEQRRKAERLARVEAEPHFEAWLADQLLTLDPEYQGWSPLDAELMFSNGGAKLEKRDDHHIVASGTNPAQDEYHVRANSPYSTVTAVRLEVLPDPEFAGGKIGRGKSGEFVITTFKLQVGKKGQSQLHDVTLATSTASSEAPPEKGKNRSKSYGRASDLLYDDPRNGWAVPDDQLEQPHEVVLTLAEPLQLEADDQLVVLIWHISDELGANLSRFRLSVTDQPSQFARVRTPMPLEVLAKSNATSPTELPPELITDLREQFLATYEPFQLAKRAADAADAEYRSLKPQAGEVNVMVMAERKEPRPTFVLERGEWTQHGEQVSPGVPTAVLDWPAERTKTRLDLAHWILDRDNPLTARVIANQLWQLCFGAGLVRTPEDFGLQGEIPLHPELLDWLAVELIESGWDIKHVLRLIVTSETYQQSSDFTPELLEVDPENKLLARGARFRLPSWMIRDVALASGDLLESQMGGPANYPYQPAGVWEALFKERFTYRPSQGDLQFRRTLYAFWRRSSTPTYLFDTSPRRTCEVRPRLTNTPLHALSLLNDENQLEAARALAVKAIATHQDQTARVDWMVQRVLARSPSDLEREELSSRVDSWLARYSESPAEAKSLLGFGQPELRLEDRVEETASYTVLASLLLNLDEAITHE